MDLRQRRELEEYKQNLKLLNRIVKRQKEKAPSFLMQALAGMAISQGMNKETFLNFASQCYELVNLKHKGK